MKRVAFIIAPFLLIQGCGDEVSVRDVCDNTPGMCSDLNTDGHCNVERSQVIVARHYEKAQPTDENKYTLLDNFEQYSRCIYRAAGIEHIKLKDKKTSRVNGYLTSLAEIKRLSNETVNSTYPKLLYYHWSRNGSEEAMEKLLQQEQQYKILRGGQPLHRHLQLHLQNCRRLHPVATTPSAARASVRALP